MSLALVIHRPDAPAEDAAGMRMAVRDAVWEVADAHWALSEDTLLVSCDLSPGYLVDHFRRALARRGYDDGGLLFVTQVGPRAAWQGLPRDAAAWLRDILG